MSKMNASNREYLKGRSRFRYKGSGYNEFSRKNNDEPEMQKARIFVGGFDLSTRRSEIEKKFMKYGKILGISMNKSFAFVQFASEASAEEAIRMENGTFFHNQVLDVNFARASDRMKAKRSYERQKAAYRDTLYSPNNNRNEFQLKDFERRESFDQFAKTFSNSQFGTERSLDHVNDCEIIVLNKLQKTYAEEIEARLKEMGIQVDLLFPAENAHIPTLLNDISNRGAMYAILITQQNELHRSVTVNILHGIPQEHRNMPLEDAMNLIAHNYDVYAKSIKECNALAKSSQGFSQQSHPENICMLLTFLLDNRPLTLAEYDCLINYLKEKRERVSKDLENINRSQISSTTINYSENSHMLQQNELQQNYFGVINPNSTVSSSSVISDCLATYPSSMEMGSSSKLGQGLGASTSVSSISFDNPTVQKALENVIHGGSLLHKANSRTVGQTDSINRMNPTMNNYYPYTPYSQYGMQNMLGPPPVAPLFNTNFDPLNKSQNF